MEALSGRFSLAGKCARSDQLSQGLRVRLCLGRHRPIFCAPSWMTGLKFFLGHFAEKAFLLMESSNSAPYSVFDCIAL
jgi:hypothetical protein